jgi:enoyl-CoA hydratase
MPELTDVRYETDGPVAIITLARPRYRNAQSWRLLDDFDAALDMAMADPDIACVLLKGEGDHFSSGHDLGTPDQEADRAMRNLGEGVESYDNFRKYNLDLLIKWRNCPKPTIAVVRGYCIFAGWMLAAVMDLVFADTSARFLAAQVEYFSHPWDIGARKAKEILFESRFIDAHEAERLGFVNRVYNPEDLDTESYNYARRVAENNPMALRMAKVAVNRTQDIQGYVAAVDAAFSDYLTLIQYRGSNRVEGIRRLGGVDLAVKHDRGERYGLTPKAVESPAG